MVKVVGFWGGSEWKKDSVDWNGEGLHPILGLTMEEIKMENEARAWLRRGEHANSDVKTPQPDHEANVRFQLERAQEMSSNWIEAVSQSLK